ncbi:MAG: 2-isopropylmalate synthase [Polaromonas sp. 39-63-203]|uniref:2-isopropylmalate synthase n=1 Tax=Polaromonas sp. TaxID=1869339 RepID=UPI000BCAA2EB|nr:2-isopropylmalate synthase [Polaromonas sp.]OYY53647.1 MAG: 2-isopropylmalate synthase [Polaromonas sp. 35-63-240]OYZ02480.1 MAG: 2-isopropylmalate synthase [Polaromonas sp. 28-63-22]OYZ84330.1 MAG: 2-isopropylmalate synthase [Polaromonas sp. 24-62-144]OZB02316.1 MAG: 2-isopropylmalate synthase [Polaromonas sp. 39-63-203]HQS33078.1 2-isopropylmalate synthase [Polaromonas sp.]
MLKTPSRKYRPFTPVHLRDRTWPDAVLTRAPVWCSVDLRDGNQALIEPMDIARKIKMFEMLVKIGFKEIEVGFPSASQVEFDFLRRLIDDGRVPDDVTIQVLTQAREPLIRRTFESLKGAKKVIVHLYNATAPVMRRVVLGMNEDEIVKLATVNARLFSELAAGQPETHWTFQYSPEMWSGTELEFSKRVVDAVTEVWQPTPTSKCIINLPSTVEHSTPNIFADMMEWMHRRLARRDAIVLSVHPHNDRGTGTAAGELALMAGADRIEGCLFGNGERTGNVDLVNIALNLYTQGVSPGLDFSEIDEIRRTVEHCNQLPVHPRHPYAGDLVYTSFSGSHQDAIKKAFSARKEDDLWDMPYLPIDPKDLGRSYEAVIRVNSQSGKGGIAYLLESEFGLELPRRLQIEFSQVVQAVMDETGKELTAHDLMALFEKEYGLRTTDAPQNLVIQETGTAGEKSFTIRAEVQMWGQSQLIEGVGTGPIDAFVSGLNAATGRSARVLDYHEHATGSGADAQAVAYLELRVDGATLFGVGMDNNIVSASLKAIVSGVQRSTASARAGTTTIAS